MEIALGMTHKIEESCQNSVPSKDHIIENMVFPPSDVVTLTALNVDLEYATKGLSELIADEISWHLF